MEYLLCFITLVTLLSIIACQPIGSPNGFGLPLGPLGPVGSPLRLTRQALDTAIPQGVNIGAVATSCACGYSYQPVCSVDGRSFPNECTARCNYAVVAYQGICRDPSPGVTCSLCPRYSYQQPVCGVDGMTYPSVCLANCRGVQIWSYGQCMGLPTMACSCPRVLRPVCGSDGRTYSNECEARCRNVFVTAQGYCGPGPGGGGPWRRGHCGCPESFHPVCAADGITYANECKATCANRRVLWRGSCQGIGISKSMCENSCTQDYNPMCSDRGITFPNLCQATCAQARVIYQGPCLTTPIAWQIVSGAEILVLDETDEEKCVCELDEDPVCDDDNNKYRNICTARCLNANIVSLSPCTANRLYRPSPSRPDYITRIENNWLSTPNTILNCQCLDMYDPVCGKNGRTFTNPCQASCASVPYTSPGPCRALQPGGLATPVPVPGDPTCSFNCAGDISPVCGENSVTYVNLCFAQCAQVAVRSQGPCMTVMANTTFCPQCMGVRLSPVCTADGRTYDNECVAMCNGRQVLHYGACAGDGTNGGCPACAGLDFDPVCGINGHTYPNMCESDCRRMPMIYKGRCRNEFCSCRSAQPELVCGSDGATYPNRCLANCRGVNVVGIGACFGAEQCICPRLLAEVCGQDGTTYDNECLAACRGVSIAFSGPCIQKK